jgi:hypothetical protein
MLCSTMSGPEDDDMVIMIVRVRVCISRVGE